MSEGIMAFSLISLLACLTYVCVMTLANYARQRRLERDKADVDKLYKALRRLD